MSASTSLDVRDPVLRAVGVRVRRRSRSTSDQLFATVERALERRRMNLDNRRLVWELQTINEIADGIARSLELDDVLAGALQCMVARAGRRSAARSG